MQRKELQGSAPSVVCLPATHTHTSGSHQPSGDLSARHTVTWGQWALSPRREPGAGAQNWSPEPQWLPPATLCLRWNATPLLCLIRSKYSQDTSPPSPGSLATQLTPCPWGPSFRIQANSLHRVTSCFNIFSNFQGVKKKETNLTWFLSWNSTILTLGLSWWSSG